MPRRFPSAAEDQPNVGLAGESQFYVDGFLDILLASSLVALAVAGLVVYNTFQILIAQRIQKPALTKTRLHRIKHDAT